MTCKQGYVIGLYSCIIFSEFVIVTSQHTASLPRAQLPADILMETLDFI